MRRVLTGGAAGLAVASALSCEAVGELWTKSSDEEPAEAATVTPATPVEKAKPVAPAKPIEPAKPVTPPSDSAGFDRAAERVTVDLLRKNLEALAADDLNGRRTPSAELDRAADILAKEYARLALEVPSRAPEYRQRFECGDPGERESSNVIGLLPGRDARLSKEFVLVSAHYDHIGVADEGDDRIFNGANDNASGVASMIAVAEVLSALPTRPRRSVLFVAFCGEELGLRGSRHFAEDPVVPLANIVADLNLEMLGRPGTATPKRAWITGMPYSTLGDRAVAVGAEVGIEFVDGAVVGFVEGRAFERSDNYPLAKHGVVAHSISTGKLDDFYHHVDDEPTLIEYEAMVPIIRAVARLAWRLAEDDAKPQWSEAGRAAGF
jgi:hypothetical protein